MNMAKLHHVIIVSLGIFFGYGLLFAATLPENPAAWGENQGDDIPLLDKQQEKKFDATQTEASTMLLNTAQWLDSFFDDRTSVSEANQTRATVKLALGYSKKDNFEIKPRFDLRLKLPSLSSRLNFLFEAAEDEDFHVENDPLSNKTMHQDSDNRKLAAALQYFVKEGETDNFSVETGSSLKYMFAGLRYRTNQDFGAWKGRFANRLRYYSDDGWENNTTYYLDNQLSAKLLFRVTSSINLLEGVSGVPHAQQFKMYQVLSAYQAIAYESGFYFNTEPSYQMTDTQFVIRYRQRFYRDWLVLEVSPRLSFPEEHDRHANPGIAVTFEAALGYNQNEAAYRRVFH
ncbi:MAG: hypothetical protein KJ630_12695 [Proteobacteria bacterium]|nr:hypothetical protein [Pseudomonadota bacterium]